jgi:hypothetical protein
MERSIMRKIFKIKCLLTLLILVFAINLAAQYDIASYQSIKEQYPNNNIIILKKKIHLIIRSGGTTPDINMLTEERILYLKNTKGANPQNSTYTSSFSELIDYEASSYMLDSDKYKKLSVKDFKEVKKFRSGIFFDDTRELVFTFPGVAEGSVTELKTTHKIHEPRFLGIFFLNEFFPVHEYELVVETDKGFDIDFTYLNIPPNSIRILEEQKKGKTIYFLNLKKRESIKFEENQPDRRYFTPHIVPVLRSYEVNNQKVKVLENTEDLYKWYATFIAGLDEGIDLSELQKIVGETTSDAMSEIEKVEQLYYWVQKNIKYIAFEDGMGGFIPRKADEVLNKRYGDCKDKTNLLHSLLKQAGIPSYFTWVGTRDIPYRYSDLCSPAVDNHMILTYKNGSDYYYLDATGSYQRIDIPTSFIQGKEVLIGISNENFEIRVVPVLSAVRNQVSDSLYMKLDGQYLSGSGILKAAGLPKVHLQYQLETEDLKEQKRYVENIVEKGNNKFVLAEYSIPVNDRFAETGVIHYTFTLGEYIRRAGNEMYLNLNLNRFWLDYKIQKDRLHPLELESALLLNDTFVFEIPAGGNIIHVPENVSIEGDDFNLEISYELMGNTIVYHHKVSVNTLLIKNENFDLWRSFLASLEKNYKETLVIQL